MNIDQFLELVKTRRNSRLFDSKPVPDEYIEKILEAARFAQSGANAQPWEFIIIKERATISKIVEMYAEYLARCWDVEKTRIPEAMHPAFRNGPPGLPGFKDAPVIIAVCGDPRAVQATILLTQFLHNEGGADAHFLKNMANTTQIMHLAAAACGLTSQWVSVNTTMEQPLKLLLDIPVELAVHTIVPIGFPIQVHTPSVRRGLDEITHHEKYDPSKYRSGEDVYQFLLSLRQRTKSSYPLTNKGKKDTEK